MITKTVSPIDLESKLAEGFTVVKENVIGGKVRSYVMEKEGDKFQWIEDENKAKREYIAAMGKAERRIYLNRSRLYTRGLDV